MLRISIALLCACFLTFLNALESNSSRLENKLVRISDAEYNYVPLARTELTFVVSIGVVHRGQQYKHVCLANMISSVHALTTVKCGKYRYIEEITGWNRDTQLVIRTHRSENPDIRVYNIHYSFCDLNSYKEGVRPPLRLHTHLAIAKTWERVPITLSELPIYADNLHEDTGDVVVWNEAEHPPSPERIFLRMIVNEMKCATDNQHLEEDNKCYLHLWSRIHMMTRADAGAPVLVGDQIVGIVTDAEMGTFEKLSPYKDFLYKLRDLVSNENK